MTTWTTTQQLILSTGSIANDGTGDTLRQGAIKINSNFTDLYTAVNSIPSYTLPTATTTALGGVKVDGTSITINNGVISSTAAYTLPTATTTALGGVKIDGTSITINNGIISSAAAYTLPTATASVLGGVKIDGTSITINNGVISGFSGNYASLTNKPARTQASATTTLIAAGATANLTITGYKGYVLYSVQTASSIGGAWVRIYTDAASRTADAARLISVDPTTTGIIAEVVTTANTTVPIAPGVIGFSNESPASTNILLAITNTNSSAGTFTITLTLLPLEQ
jgi:hypothetical protein